jgi:hypothetical protein
MTAMEAVGVMIEYITPQQYQIAANNGIDKARLEHRVRVDGWSIDRAIFKPKRSYNRHGEWLNVARSNGIPSNTFHSRIKKGWSPEFAASTPLLSPEEVGRLGGKVRKKYDVSK